MISLVQASTATPENKFSTTEMVASMMHKLSPELINTICSLGVENRYSAIENYADFLNGAPINLTSSTTDLGVNATRKCIEEWGGDPSQIGLLVAATNTPDQVLPCLASEVMGRTHGLLPRSLSTVSMQSQGCSVMLKSVEVAQWYLAANPGKMAMVLMSEAHTPLAGPLCQDEYYGFREIARMRKNNTIDDAGFEQQRNETALLIQMMLFGDGAVALLLGQDVVGKPAFGPISHLTNDCPEDMNLLTMIRNSPHPSLKGKPQYFMRPSVPARGAHYAVQTVNDVLHNPNSPVSDMSQVDDCLIHTGSKKILDGVCSQLHLDTDSTKVEKSYDVLENFGNLSSASTGFMLAGKKEWTGPTMVVGFGVGFTASAGLMSIN
jgi:3-oxoacyl-[acyl-carrier-protein] synthase III